MRRFEITRGRKIKEIGENFVRKGFTTHTFWEKNHNVLVRVPLAMLGQLRLYKILWPYEKVAVCRRNNAKVGEFESIVHNPEEHIDGFGSKGLEHERNVCSRLVVRKKHYPAAALTWLVLS